MDFNEIDKLINTLKKNLEVIENNGVVEPETKIDALTFNKNVEEIKKRLYNTTDEGSFLKMSLILKITTKTLAHTSSRQTKAYTTR